MDEATANVDVDTDTLIQVRLGFVSHCDPNVMSAYGAVDDLADDA